MYFSCEVLVDFFALILSETLVLYKSFTYLLTFIIFTSLKCILQVTIDRHPVRFFVHKRPHVDFFLDVVSI